MDNRVVFGGWKMSDITGTPLARLVVFMVCLAVAGTLVSGVHYYTIDLPAHQALSAPENWGSSCMAECKKETAQCSAQYCQGSYNIQCANCNLICGAMCGDLSY